MRRSLYKTFFNFFYLAIIVHSALFRWNSFVSSSRIRHARSRSLYMSMESYQSCPIKEISDSKCPQQSECRSNSDCFKEFGAKANVCVCDAHLCGMVCVAEDLKCPNLHNPANGKVNYIRKNPNHPYFIVGTKAVYSCESGYNVLGSAERFCLATSQWSGKAPQCTNQTDLCPNPPYLTNAETIGDNNRGYRNGDTVKFRCQKGFHDKYIQEVKARCENNKWLMDNLKCEPIECGKMPQLVNGAAMYPRGYSYKTSAYVFCNDGYKITCRPENNEFMEQSRTSSHQGSCERTCQDNGKWSGLSPICDPILCPHLPPPKNGNVSGFWTKVNSVVSFYCNPGYELVGSKFRNCQRSGRWDGEITSCKIRDCGPPPTVAHAILTYSSTTFGSKAIYKCVESTTPWGESNTLTCGETSNHSLWLPRPPPQCLKHCFKLTVNHAIVMINDPNDGQIPQKEMVPHALTLNVNCSSGYALDKAILPTCKNGTWTYIPSCNPAPCLKRPPILTNGIARFYSRKHEAIARYYCYSGYYMQSSSGANNQMIPALYRCKFGQWRGGKLHCIPSRCQLPQPPRRGQIYLIGKNGNLPVDSSTNKPRHSDVLQYECEKNYRLVGTRHAVCLSGKWSPSEMPKCEKIMHDSLPFEWVFYKSGPFENEVASR